MQGPTQRPINRYTILVIVCLLAPISVEADVQKPYAMPRTQVLPIKDSTFDRLYELYIKLPEKYFDNNDASYPVIYFTDAVWHIDILSAATQSLLEDVILVGISWQKDISDEVRQAVGEHASRGRDYSVRQSSDPELQAKYNFGHPENHLVFIRNDVIQTIENNYRTDPNNRTYFGYSAGGLFGAYILLAQPDTFKNYILGSPALKDNIPILSKINSSPETKRKNLNANVFISYGTLEHEPGEYINEFIAMLKNRNDETLFLQHEVIEGGHQTAFPNTGISSVNWLSSLMKNEEKE